MKENKVISLELAKKISEIAEKKGIELPESEWFWTNSLDGKNLLKEYRLVNGSKEGSSFGIPAYDTAELGEMLPYKFNSKIGVSRCFYWLKMTKTDNQFVVSYFADNPKSIGIEEAAETEAEARGEMCLYLIKNNLLEYYN